MTDANIDETSPLFLTQSQSRDLSDERTDLQRKVSVWLILISAGFERLAFYALAGNLVLFLTSEHIHWSSEHSVTVTLIFLGNTYERFSLFEKLLCCFIKVQVIYQLCFLLG